MKKIIMFIAIAMTAFGGAVSAQKPAVVVSDKTGWHKIGETTVDFTNDHDEVAVLMADRFAALKFKVTDAPIDLLDLDVYFEDGTMKTVKVGYAIKAAGESSRVIDLPGSEQNLQKIVFRYKTVANAQNKKAHVEIWGMKTNTDKGNKNMNKDHK
jgi:hypothetical protein